jgi:chromosome segregation ATPase
VLSEGVKAPELGNLLEALARTHAERDAAAKDLAASEKLQAAEDLRLGMQEAAAETEWKACESAARDVEDLLRKLDEQRRQAAQEQAASGQPGRNPRLARLDAEYGTLRERAAALRASTLGARARLDQARAGRRQAAAAMAAGITGQTRDRAEAEGRIRSLTVEVGQTAFRLKPPAPALKAAFTRVERLEETVKERERQLAVVARSASSYDHRKLAAGLGLLTGLCGVVGVTLWALLR